MNEAPTLPRPGPSALGPALRILLADDSLTFRVATQGLLRRLGHVVDAVPDGALALAAATRGRYDIVLMDIRMPEMDGLEAARLMRQRLTGPVRPLIVAVTAEPPSKEEGWYVAAGMDDVLTKPLSPPRLAEVLERAGAPPLGPAPAAAPVPAPAPAPVIAAPATAAVPPVEVVVDGSLCELRVWSEREWADLPESERPLTCVFCEGLGWVGAVPKIALN